MTGWILLAIVIAMLAIAAISQSSNGGGLNDPHLIDRQPYDVIGGPFGGG